MGGDPPTLLDFGILNRVPARQEVVIEKRLKRLLPSALKGAYNPNTLKPFGGEGAREKT
jgi:hypothetical protein